LVTLRTTNTSGVPVKVGSAAVVLFRVSIEEGALRFDQEAQEDPLDYVSQMTSDQQAIESGRPFGRREGRTHSLAPGETVKTDVAFPVVTTPGGLMAIRVRMEANKKKENIIAWTSFSYLNLESATTARRRWLLRPRSLVGDA